MASRYGRKKRRAHLARIKELEAAAIAAELNTVHARGSAKQAVDALAAMVERMESWDDDVSFLLGPYSALQFEEGSVRENRAGEISRMREHIDSPDFTKPMSEVCELVTVRAHEIYRFIFDLPPDALDDLKRYMRLRIVNGDVPVRDPRKQGHQAYNWNYAVSKALFERGLAERDIIHIAEQIAVQFHHRMSGELGRKNGAAATR